MTARLRSSVLNRAQLRKAIRSFLLVAWPVAALVGIYLVIDVVVRGVTDLGEAGYREPSMTLTLLRQSAFAVPVLLLLWGLVVWRTRSVGLRWPGFERGWSFRLPVGVCIVFLTWWFSTYDYNLYFDRGHWLDRMLLVALAGLALWRPVFAVPWIFLVATIMTQFYYPIGGYSVAEQFQLVRVVELFVALTVIRLVVGRWRLTDYLVVVIALVAGGLFLPGVGKLRLGWLTIGAHVELNLFSAYGAGWLGMLSFDSIGTILRALRPLAWPMLIGTLLVEIGAVFILWSRRTLIAWLGLFVAFHIGVFALTGILFWRWMALEVALLIFLFRDRLITVLPIFNWRYAVLGSGLVVLAPFWSMPVNLAWLDSPVTYSYRFFATDAAGNVAQLSPQFFRPYDYQFSLGAFEYLSGDADLFPHFWGAVSDREILEEVYAAATADEILRLEDRFGSLLFDEARARDFDSFITTTVSNWNERGSPNRLWRLIKAPDQIWTVNPDAYDGEGPIESVAVWRVLSYWDGSEYREIRTTMIREIDIETGP